jgi:hypothetical protein
VCVCVREKQRERESSAVFTQSILSPSPPSHGALNRASPATVPPSRTNRRQKSISRLSGGSGRAQKELPESLGQLGPAFLPLILAQRRFGLGLVVCCCDPSTQEAKAGEFQVQGQLCYTASLRSCLKTSRAGCSSMV